MILRFTLHFSPPPPIPKPFSSSHNLSSLSIRHLRFRCGRRSTSSSWFSNAEPGEEEEDTWKKTKKRRWWSGEEEDDEFDDDEFDVSFDDGDLFEEPWEKIWFLKVFKTYGYLLPVVFLSMLLANGPKAFLMALAIPLGQSAISLAIDKIWGKAREAPRPRYKSRRQPFTRSDDEYTGRPQEENSGTYSQRPSYQTWVSADPTVQEGSSQNGPTFGGWDELDKERQRSNNYERRQQPRGSGAPARRLSKKGKYREIPLFMRLLVAVFPFLGSWFRIL